MLRRRDALLGLTGTLIASGCGDSAQDDDGGPDISGVVYQGGATDEALEALLAATVKSDPTKNAIFDWPASDEILAADVFPSFCWHTGEATAARNFRPNNDATPTRGAPGLLERATELVLGVRTAHAHGTPISGPAYFLVFSTEDDPMLLRVFTTATVFTPDDNLFARLKKPNKPLQAKLIWAEFETNRIAPGGGPWDGETLPFSIRQS